MTKTRLKITKTNKASQVASRAPQTHYIAKKRPPHLQAIDGRKNSHGDDDSAIEAVTKDDEQNPELEQIPRESFDGKSLVLIQSKDDTLSIKCITLRYIDMYI